MPKLYSLYSQISIPLLWNTPKMAFWCVFCKICWDDTCFRVLLAHTYLGIIGLPSFIFIRHGRKISSLPLKLQGECDTFVKFQAPWPQSITHGWYLTGPQSCCTHTSLFQESPIMWCHWTVIVRYALIKKTILFGNFSQTSGPPPTPPFGNPLSKNFF